MSRTTLQAALHSQLERRPERKALAWYDANGVCIWKSAAELHAAASNAAGVLLDQGLRPGDACVIVLPSEEGAGVAFLGALFAGARPLLVAPPTLQRFNPDLLRVVLHTLRRTRARAVIYNDSIADVADEVRREARRATFVRVEDLRAASTASVSVPHLEPETAVAYQLTSGTTGLPRIGMWSHTGVLAALDGMASAMKLDDDDLCFNWTPLYHDMGLVNNFLLCLAKGVPLVMQKPQDFVKRPALWLRGLAETGATLTWSPNFGFAMTAERVRDDDLDGVRLDGVRAFYNAAERIHLDTIETFHRRFALKGVRRSALKTNLGCVENVGGATFSDAEGTFVVEHVDAKLLQKRVARPLPPDAPSAVAVVGVGKPNPGLDATILSPAGKSLADGCVGEIAFRTPSRMLGYLGDGRATKRALHGDLLRTGDLGYMRGREVFWVGRVRERITVRGKKLDPSDFEPVLLQVAGLRTGCFAAFGVDDPEQGTERIVIVAEIRDQQERRIQEIAAEIREQVFRRLDVLVGEVVLVKPATLAKTSSGKRRHRHFRQLYLEHKLHPVDPGPVHPDRVAV